MDLPLPLHQNTSALAIGLRERWYVDAVDVSAWPERRGHEVYPRGMGMPLPLHQNTSALSIGLRERRYIGGVDIGAWPEQRSHDSLRRNCQNQRLHHTQSCEQGCKDAGGRMHGRKR